MFSLEKLILNQLKGLSHIYLYISNTYQIVSSPYTFYDDPIFLNNNMFDSLEQRRVRVSSTPTLDNLDDRSVALASFSHTRILLLSIASCACVVVTAIDREVSSLKVKVAAIS